MLNYSTYLNELRDEAGETYSLINPHTREEIEEIPECTNEQMETAIAKSLAAFEKLKTWSSAERSEVLERTARIAEENSERFAKAIVNEAGKPVRFAKGEVARTVETLKFSAIESRKLEGESIRLDAANNGGGRDAYTIYEPIGVIGAITPFNFPLNLVIHKVGPAIAAGNTIIVKPAEKTPLSSLLLREAFLEAGLPEGAFQVITGDGPRLGKVLIDHEQVAKITFTGSPEVGKLIKSQSGLKKVTLELGNNSALYIDESQRERLDDIAQKAVVGAFSYNGQVCISTQRIYVHEAIAEEFTRHFIEATSQLKYGDPLEESTDLSALIDEKSKKRLLEWIVEASHNGAEIVHGGKACQNGIEPTILKGVQASDKVSCQEVFGPVAIVNAVKSGEEALAEMNNSNYGLNAGIFTTDLSQALQMSHQLDVGQVLVNDIPTLRFDHMPYGGRKDSGYGYEGVKYAVREMVKRKMISLNYSF
ncbi:aldehyde dehydrogenase family protein [Halobacillus sp. H74]|uniref:aldehyde dehydrogenase family protein n=1 Tax=Halobacillus sp. H74 TaxID=3457436 RepID=UPI003FCD97D2